MEMSDHKRDIATRRELERLKADRKNDPAVPAYDHPAPSWALDSEDPRRIKMRMRERRIRRLENRLDGAVRKMERDFDQSS